VADEPKKPTTLPFGSDVSPEAATPEDIEIRQRALRADEPIPLQELLSGWDPEKTGSPVIVEMARRLRLLAERHQPIETCRGEVCRACSNEDLKSWMPWPCPDAEILAGRKP
jgi:hypothetical protein